MIHDKWIECILQNSVSIRFCEEVTAVELFRITQHVIKEIEDFGFHVERIVPDNVYTNLKCSK